MPDSTLFQGIARGLREAIAYERGEMKAQTNRLSRARRRVQSAEPAPPV